MPNSKNIRTSPEAQADFTWKPPSGTLANLTRLAWERAGLLEAAGLTRYAPGSIPVPSLAEALLGDTVEVIAEVKRRSPSKGLINPSLDSGSQAAAYTEGGAAAISVLTEPTAFGGSDADLALVHAATILPMLKKDFHVSEAQLLQARHLGASAALLIVRALAPSLVHSLAAAARALGLEIVFEIRNEAQLEIALAAGATMIGVNNRDLETLEIDRTTVERMVPRIPAGCVAIAESGYRVRGDIEDAARAGADAVLVGSAVSGATDPAGAVRSLCGVPVTSRRR